MITVLLDIIKVNKKIFVLKSTIALHKVIIRLGAVIRRSRMFTSCSFTSYNVSRYTQNSHKVASFGSHRDREIVPLVPICI